MVTVSTYYLSVNENFMTSSVVLCDFPNTTYSKLKALIGTKDFGLQGVRNSVVVFSYLILCPNLF